MSQIIRLMGPADLDFAAACTRAEGWLGETRAVFEDFLEYDANGCFVAEMDGQRAGMCIATAYQQHGFMGELIVVPDQRGQGLGTALFTRALSHLHRRGVRSISLDGDTPAVPMYERAGFRRICRSLRFYGTIPGAADHSVRQMTAADVPEVCRLDAELFGDDRSFFLYRKVDRFPELCFVTELNCQLCGYLLACPGDGVISVGPWTVIPGSARPLALLERLTQATPDAKLRIGVLERNRQAVTLLRTLPGLEEGNASWRMVLGQEDGPGFDKRLYAIGSAATG